MRGQKTGGRTAGTPNKRTADVMGRLESSGCDPLEGLARIAADPNTDTALRARVLADLLPYLYPKRKALEVTGADSGAVEVEVAGAKELLARKLSSLIANETPEEIVSRLRRFAGAAFGLLPITPRHSSAPAQSFPTSCTTGPPTTGSRC